MAASQVVVHEEGETLKPIGRTLGCVCLVKVCGVFLNSLECIRLSLVLLMVGAGQTGCHGNSLILLGKHCLYIALQGGHT